MCAIRGVVLGGKSASWKNILRSIFFFELVTSSIQNALAHARHFCDALLINQRYRYDINSRSDAVSI